jgi:diguanylate cyclase (GGDEF)-like protein
MEKLMTTNPEATKQDFTQYRTLLEFSSDPGICVTECETEFRPVLVNDAACRLFGRKRKDFLKLHLSDIFPRFELDTLRQELHAKNHAHFESEHLSTSGKYPQVKVLACRILHEHKEYIFVFFKKSANGERRETEQLRLKEGLRQSVVCSIARDITQQKQMENELRDSAQAYRSLVENLPDLVVRYDRECRRVYFKPFGLQTADATATETRHQIAFKHWHGDIPLEDYKAKLRQVMENGVPINFFLTWSSPSDAHMIYYDMRIVAESNAGGQIIGVLVIARNITAIKNQESVEKIRSSIFEHLVRGKELEELLDEITRFATIAIDDSHCSILLLNETTQNLAIAATSRQLPKEYVDFIEKFAVGKNIGICGCVAAKSEIGIVEDIEKEKACQPCRHMALQANIRACWSVPILAPHGKALGIVTVYSDRIRKPTDQQLEQLRQIGYLTALVAEHKHYEYTIKKQASYDTLTGLTNRRLFADRLREEIAKAKRDHTHLGLLFIDLDHFKQVNDTLGHEYGDRLLVEAAQRIRSCVRESDVVARFGGDEFVALIINVNSPDILGRVAHNIVDMISQPFQFNDYSAQVSASIGIANYPDDSHELEELIKFADSAMYAAKKKGRNGYEFFCSQKKPESNKHESNVTNLINTTFNMATT